MQSLSPAEAELVATAYHEAGHAVMALSLGRSIQKVTISPRRTAHGESRLGICELKKGRSRKAKDALEDDALILLSGMVAEARFTGEYCDRGAAQDLRLVRSILASRASTLRQLERLEKRLLSKTEHVLFERGHAQAIDSIAAELIAKTTISGRAAKHLFEQSVKAASQ
ncbi:ATP-dependent zinc metalloprotease FtsH [Novipirellula aureliae]|uniref:ATP-dependent zinc metalloprotease FtsH n=1 Tax=Novipirellula aureliae TaxID=2527966 RepID=A0A5C6E710_9BACT|nr:cell division protein FtsH [Novipirellula aureliae]TWU43256.1 ATP-dependent zinc metalloprotease FtsH [Novipirellula aureliae]